MRTQALLGPVPTSAPRGRNSDNERSGRVVRKIRLTPSIAWRAWFHNPWTRGTLRRWHRPFRTRLGRPPRRVLGIYAGLSNSR